MPSFDSWTLETIRSQGAMMNWIEEARFEWSAATLQALRNILESKTIVLITDGERKWFETYALSTINKTSNERPIIPIVSIDSLYPSFDSVSGGEMIDVIDDMLDITYKGDYIFWYVGRGDDKRADIAKRNDESYLWIMDEVFINALSLKSYDKKLDIKLLQLFELFNTSLSAALFGEVDIDE